MKVKRIIHVGLSAAHMRPVKRLYSDLLGLEVTHEEVLDGEIKLCFLPVGDSQIEIFADRRPPGPVTKIMAEQGGPGIHHLAFEVADIKAALEELKKKGVPLLDEEPKPGAHGTSIAFLDPRATHGVLIELVQVNS